MEKIRLHKRECNRYQLPTGSYMNFLSEGNETSGFLIDLSFNGLHSNIFLWAIN